MNSRSDGETQASKKSKVETNINVKKLKIFFEAILSNHFQRDDDKRIWTFDITKTSAKWINNLPFSHFYNRKCYDDYITVIFHKNNENQDKNVAHFLGGTSGTGKSSFVNRLFVKIIQDHMEKKEKVKIFYQDMNLSYLIVLNNLEVNVENMEYPNIKCDFHISDTKDIKIPYSTRFSLLISLPKVDYFEQYRKVYILANSRDAVILDDFIPLWTSDEFNALKRERWNLEQSQIDYRHSVVGGSIRYFLIQKGYSTSINFNLSLSLLKLSPPEFQPDIVDDVINFMKKHPLNPFSVNFPKKNLLNINLSADEENELNNAVVEYCTNEIIIYVDFYNRSSNFSHFYDMCFAITEFFNIFGYLWVPSETINYLFSGRFVHYLNSCDMRWASDIMFFLVNQFHPSFKNTYWEDFNKISSFTQDGLYIERIHQRLIDNPSILKNHHSIIAYSHDSLKLIDSLPFKKSSKLKESIIHKESDILTLDSYTYYGKPISQIYPAIDAIIQPNIIIQITTASSHKKLQYLYTRSTQYLKDKNNIILFFITPPNVNFEFDTNLKNINQFHLKLDPFSPPI